MTTSQNKIVVYQPNETVRLVFRLGNKSGWLMQAQLSELFQCNVSGISHRIKLILKTEGWEVRPFVFNVHSTSIYKNLL